MATLDVGSVQGIAWEYLNDIHVLCKSHKECKLCPVSLQRHLVHIGARSVLTDFTAAKVLAPALKPLFVFTGRTWWCFSGHRWMKDIKGLMIRLWMSENGAKYHPELQSIVESVAGKNRLVTKRIQRT